TSPRLPIRARSMSTQAGQFLPVLASVIGTEDGGVFDSGEDGLRVAQRRLQMPDAFEFPGMGCAVVPFMRAGYTFVAKLVTHRLPGFAAIIRPLNDLPKPTAGLRREELVWVHGRTLDVVNLPTGKMRSGDLPVLPLAIRRQNESTFPCSDQNSYATHGYS